MTMNTSTTITATVETLTAQVKVLQVGSLLVNRGAELEALPLDAHI